MVLPQPRVVWQTLMYFASCALQSIIDVETTRRLMDAILDPEFEKIKEELLKKLAELSRCLRQKHLSTAGVDVLARV